LPCSSCRIFNSVQARAEWLKWVTSLRHLANRSMIARWDRIASSITSWSR
jgi:hypothetical protein